MGRRPRQGRVWREARRMLALTTILALLIAPIVVILTHGPTAHAVAAEMTTGAAAHGHDHGHGELVGELKGERGGTLAAGLFSGHDATDHEHPLQALVCQPVGTQPVLASKAPREIAAPFRGRTLDGPRRPPRTV